MMPDGDVRFLCDPISGKCYAPFNEIMEAMNPHAHQSAALEWIKELGPFLGGIGSLVWPLALLLGVWLFRAPIAKLLTGGKVQAEVFGIKLNIQRELDQSASEAVDTDSGPTERELKRANELARLAAGASEADILSEATRLARRYEETRALMPSGIERTRAMNAIAAQMRTIGKIAWPYRYELTVSPSPGKRLQAITCLQVLPDLDLIDWLVERAIHEVPFISRQALIAIDLAAKHSFAQASSRTFEKALAQLNPLRETFARDEPRLEVFERLTKHVEGLRPVGQPAGSPQASAPEAQTNPAAPESKS
jgi:hypothetical protein